MKVHIHGNCQSYVLSAMLREICPEWEVTFFEVHADPIITQNADYRTAIMTSDIILSQPVHEGYRGRTDLSLNWIRDAAKPGAELIVIPAMHFDGHHLGFGTLPGLGDLCTNAVAAHLIAAGVPAGAAVDMLLSEELFDAEFVQAEINLSLAEMVRRERDDKIDVPLSPFSGAFSGNVQMFHIVNHPSRPIYAYLLNKIMERLSIPGRDTTLAGQDYQSIPHIPMCRSVAYHCAARDGSMPAGTLLPALVHIHGHPPITQKDYFSMMIAQLASHSTSAIRAAIHGAWQSEAFLKRLAQKNPGFPKIDVWVDR